MGEAIILGMGAQAARSEKTTISPARGSRELGTMRDYVPLGGAAARQVVDK